MSKIQIFSNIEENKPTFLNFIKRLLSNVTYIFIMLFDELYSVIYNERNNRLNEMFIFEYVAHNVIILKFRSLGSGVVVASNFLN